MLFLIYMINLIDGFRVAMFMTSMGKKYLDSLAGLWCITLGKHKIFQLIVSPSPPVACVEGIFICI